MISSDTPVIDPIELLTSRDNRTPSVLGQIWNPVCGVGIGVIAACVMNWAFRKPVWSGLQRHAIMGAVGGSAAYYLEGVRDNRLATRDAVLRHYVELHPEDFPPIPRKKYADVLEEWVPIR